MTRQGYLPCLGRHYSKLKELLAHSLADECADAVTNLEKNGSIKSDWINKTVLKFCF